MSSKEFFWEDAVAFNTQVASSLKERKAALERAEKLPPAPRPIRKCSLCGLPLNVLAECSKHAVEMRNFKTEFDLGNNWPQKLSEAAAEEFRLEEREEELISLADSLKNKRDETSSAKFVKIVGRAFKSKITETVEHQDGLLDTVRNRLSVIREAMPKLTRAAQAYLQEQSQVPTEGQIFQQRKRQEASERILL